MLKLFKESAKSLEDKAQDYLNHRLSGNERYAKVTKAELNGDTVYVEYDMSIDIPADDGYETEHEYRTDRIPAAELEDVKPIKESTGWNDLNSSEQSAAEYALDLIANRPDMDIDADVDEGCSFYNSAHTDYNAEYEADFPEIDSSKVRAYVKSKLNINESLINEKFLSSSETMDMLNLMFHTIDRVGKDVMIDYANAMERSLKAHTLKHSKFEETLATPYSYVERLPDGHNAYSYETQDGSILVTISGDMNREYQHRVYIVAYIETEDSEVTYVKHFTYYTQFDEAVMLANNIVFACEDKKSAKDIAKLCKSMGMEQE